MSLDLGLLGSKLRRYRDQFQFELSHVAQSIGISIEDLQAMESGIKRPSGDQLLVLADFYKCDYKFFISNERVAPIDQTETLFRKHGDALSKDDRWAIQEFLFLCECEAQLTREGHKPVRPFQFVKQGVMFKQHGRRAAQALRKHLDYDPYAVHQDVYSDFTSIGFHVFRRKLHNSEISGLFINHPFAGKCILVNYDEDVYRQRFTVAHEAAHAILDGEEVGLTLHNARWNKRDLSEIRANNFASYYLMPHSLLAAIPDSKVWTDDKVLNWAGRLKVNPQALVFALKDAGLLDETATRSLQGLRLKETKEDPELPSTLPTVQRQRRLAHLHRGLSSHYVGLCFDAYAEGTISAGRLAEMLLVPYAELSEVAGLFGRRM